MGLQTRGRKQRNQHSTASKNPKGDGTQTPTEPKINELLLLHLIAQTKEQQNEINALRSDMTRKKGLEQQESSVRELKRDIAELHMQITKKFQEKKNHEVQT